jgi:hypothetical protein
VDNFKRLNGWIATSADRTCQHPICLNVLGYGVHRIYRFGNGRECHQVRVATLCGALGSYNELSHVFGEVCFACFRIDVWHGINERQRQPVALRTRIIYVKSIRVWPRLKANDLFEGGSPMARVSPVS